MSLTEKVERAKDDFDEVYEAGKKAEYDAFWDAYQYNGNRDSYASAFYNIGWTDSIYNPKYDIVCTANGQSLFAYSRITDTKVSIDVSKATNAQYLFDSAERLVTIRNLIISENTSVGQYAFRYCSALVNLTITGTINGAGWDFHWSTKLSHDSLMNIINALKDGVSPTTITLGTTNLNKLTDAEKAIATQKGWTLA